MPGKADWLAHNLPVEGELLGVARREDLEGRGRATAMRRPTWTAFDLDGTLLDPRLSWSGREQMGEAAVDAR